MSGKINILVDGHVFDGMFQGSRTFLKGLYSNLANSDRLNIHVAANDLDNLEKEFGGLSANLNFVKLNSNSKYKRLAWEFPKLVGKYHFDYIHYQYIDSLTKPCRTIITIHDVLFLEFKNDFSWLYRQKKHLFKRAAVRADILTTDSEYSKKAIHNYLDIKLKDIHVVRPALEKEFFKSRDILISKEYVQKVFPLNKYILYISRIEPRKNHILLLRAFSELELWSQGYKLVFVGKKSINAPEIEKFYSEASLDEINSIIHLESVSHYDLMHLITAASVFVYPSCAEGFGYPPLEAAAMGTETLLSNATCLSEFDFFTDRFFNPDDLSELVQKIKKIIDGKEMDSSIQTIQKKIYEQFQWDLVSEKFESLIANNFWGIDEKDTKVG